MSKPEPTTFVKDIGEKGLLERLQQFCPPEVVGDDAAVITTQSGTLVVTTDMLVDGVHFSDRTTTPEDAGWRAAAANLSDLAAMGASPLGITVALGVPNNTPVNWIERLYQGITQCLQTFDTFVIGGDVCRSPVMTISITAFGEVQPERIIRRSTAQVEDAIVVTGVHGASRAGLELLLQPEIRQSFSNSAQQKFIQAHQRPQPRLDVLPILWEVISQFQLKTDSECKIHVAGMDSSDGLADAIVQLCQMSQVGAKVERSQIPLADELKDWSSLQALDWALYGGEDFELVLCLPPAIAQALVERLGNQAAIIGEIIEEPGVYLTDRTGKTPGEVLNLNRGFQHF
ncbi:thiamine-phosphate kinase [Gloeocapsopsis dulcis]|uniref:Thiamine-monophosphate kinase n=1 Tax=Gloeocapsopsis dulcis AAB1 = 1H9 TaxID=1433147 RepID=A0A6N8FXK6_9CHRO|nr:thiamine-phosphate kinase [Gloeocapsopsis dulcis]MUL37494.1 thiamine-phosphate kinase [Gloeocapsopsis dulcis AAB1 = 1H9]WNN89490.1 thiamine-phosphate kinase [Gloeocapsopsis dulcis]